VRLCGRSLAEAFGESLYGNARRYLSAVMATDAVRYDEEPSMRAGMLGCRREHLADRILIVLPYQTRVG
jgi:hypothetical protein